jgi:hypothetical protein
MKCKLIPAASLFLFLAVTPLIISSCGAMVRAKYKEDDKQIPLGFGKEDVTLLVLRKSIRYNRWLEERFPENYFGKYVIINAGELQSSKYADVKKYRYIFDETEFTNRRVSANGNPAGEMETYVSFTLKDRSTGKLYQSRKVYASPNALMKQYLIALENVRKKNAGE